MLNAADVSGGIQISKACNNQYCFGEILLKQYQPVEEFNVQHCARWSNVIIDYLHTLDYATSKNISPHMRNVHNAYADPIFYPSSHARIFRSIIKSNRNLLAKYKQFSASDRIGSQPAENRAPSEDNKSSKCKTQNAGQCRGELLLVTEKGQWLKNEKGSAGAKLPVSAQLLPSSANLNC